MRTIIDKGPSDPGPEPTIPQGQTSSPEHDAWLAAKRDYDDWHKANDGAAEPREIQMHDHDAAHAVTADPERYELVGHTAAEQRALLRSRMPIEARIAALEAAYDELVDDGEDDDADPVYPQHEPAPEPQSAPPAPAPAPKATA